MDKQSNTEAPGAGHPKLRWGVMSTASIAVKNVKGMRMSGSAEVIAVASRTLAKAQEFAQKNGIEKAYGSYEELLNDKTIDAVYIPLPTSLHVHWVSKAAEAKKHILVEKPVGLNAAEVQQMIEVCRVNGVMLMDGVMWHHHPRADFVRKMIHRGEIGTVRHMHSVLCFYMPPERLKTDIRVKKDGDPLGCIGDVGWYNATAFLMAQHYKLPQTVFAQQLTVSEENVATSVAGVVKFDECIATFECGFVSQKRSCWEISGEKGTIRMDDFHHPRFELDAEVHLTKAVDGALQTEVLHVPSAFEQHARMFQEFARCVREGDRGNSAPVTGGAAWEEIALKTQQLVDAMEKSWRSGQIVHLQ